MTEKRYKLIRPHYHSHFFDSKEERNLSWYEIIDLLNENEQLKSELSTKDIQLDFLKDENRHMRDLVNENEQLKQENRKLKEDLEHCANQFTDDGKNVLLSLR